MGRTIKRVISDLLLVFGVVLIASAAGVWFRSQQSYAVMEDESTRLQVYAAPQDEGPPVIDWNALKAINPQIVAWVYIPHSSINYPVCQADNNEFYLHRSPERVWTESGSIFLDCDDAAPGMINQQSIIYGHHMRNGIMFKQIADFDNQSFFDSVSTIWYCTPEANYELAPLYLYYVKGGDTTVRQFDFESPEAFHHYLSYNLANAITRSPLAEVAVTKLERIMTLCTCNYIDGKGRSVLVCAEKAALLV